MAANETIMSTKFIAVTPTDEIAADSPSTKRMFERFEPTTFPIARSASPLEAATADVTSSGSDVPIATIVSPTNVSDIPAARARLFALSTTTCPPTAMAIAPPTMKIALFLFESIITSSVPSSSVLSFKA